MIRVTIELVPGGFEPLKRTLHVIEMWNEGHNAKASDTHGNYGYRISRKVGSYSLKPSWLKEGRIEGFPRQAKNSVHLLRAILNDAYEGK